MVAKMTWAPSPMTSSMASTAASGWTQLRTWAVTLSPITASIYCRPRSWARTQSLSSGLCSLMKATLSRSGNTAFTSRPQRPWAGSSSPFCSWVSVLTEMGSVWERTFTSAHTAFRVFTSSAAGVVLSCSKGYTRSHTSSASAAVTGRLSPPAS